MRTRSPALRLHVGVAERRRDLLDPVRPRRDAHSAASSFTRLTASPPCAGARDTRFPRRGAVPPFRTSPHPVAPAKPALEPRGSQRRLLVPVRVTLDGDGDGQGGDVAG